MGVGVGSIPIHGWMDIHMMRACRETIDIPEKHVARLIGPRGSLVQELQSLSGAHISIDSCRPDAALLLQHGEVGWWYVGACMVGGGHVRFSLYMCLFLCVCISACVNVRSLLLSSFPSWAVLPLSVPHAMLLPFPSNCGLHNKCN